MKKSASGFTLVELLIVIVVIAILATISIVAYNSVQARAHQAALYSDFRHISNKLDIYKVRNGEYPSDPNGTLTTCEEGTVSSPNIKPQLETIDIKLSRGAYETSIKNTNLLYLSNNKGTKYALLGYAKGNPAYYISNSTGEPELYPGTGVTKYPGGAVCKIANFLGISAEEQAPDFEYYYIYMRSSGGFRIW